MSNKFGDKFYRYLQFLIILVIAIPLFGFEPKAGDFLNSYQYDLYRSWLKTEKLDSDLPAGFSREKVVRSFLDENGKEINVEYDWQNWKISSQREMIPFLFYADENLKIKSYINYLERFIYRLNCSDKKFLFDLIDHNKMILEYKKNRGKQALKLIWQERPLPRIDLQSVVLIANADTLSFKFSSNNMNEFKISFPQVYNMQEILADIKEREIEESEDFFPQIITPDVKQVTPQIAELTLAEYIRNYFNTPPRRELLHNKIKNIGRFLEQEFPQYSITNEKDLWHLKIDEHEEKLGGNISLEVVWNDNMIDMYPLNDVEVVGNQIKLNSQYLDASSLTEKEITGIKNYLPQLIYEHRAIGTQLLNFLLIHDEVASTLVVYSEGRELYETDSYADILLLLNEYWQDRKVFFGVENLKKINGTIEFKGFLAARTQTGVCDWAEIYFHISKEYKIDLIMMILHPALDKKG